MCLSVSISVGLCCPVGFSLVTARGGSSLIVVHGLLIVVASLGAEHGLSGVQTLVAEACGLSGCGSPALEHVLNSCGAQA